MTRPVLAIDPGPEESGWCLLGADGVPTHAGNDPNDALLGRLHTHAADLVIEMVASYGMPVGRDIFATCVWIGRFQQATPEPERVTLTPRLDVKLHLCHSPRAKDANVWQALVDRFGAPGTKKAPGVLYGITKHARAALALAVTHYDRRGA